MKKEYLEALEALVESGRCTKEELEKFSEKEQLVIAQATLEYLDKGESLVIRDLEEPEYDCKIPDIITFIEDPYYLGGELGYPLDNQGRRMDGEQRQLYDFWLDKLEEIYIRHPGKYHEIDITGAIGIGKTTFMNVIAAYDYFVISSIKNPQLHFGLMPSTKIVFAFFNILKDLADDVGYGQYQGLLESSPCFRERMRRNTKLKEGFQLQPTKGFLFKVGSRVSHTLGLAVLEAHIDEANFGGETSDKRDNEKKSQVYENYLSLLRRRESRFPDLPGHFCLGSSKRATSDFLESHIEKQRGKSNVLVIDASQYEVKRDRGDYSGKTFRVLLGDETRDPKILEENETVPMGLEERVEVIPVEHKQAFEDDIIEALRDISGKAAQPKHAFFTDRQKIRDLFTTRVAPWNYTSKAKQVPNTINISFYGDDQIIDFLIKDLIFTNNGKLPYPDAPRFISFDTGYSGDALGCAMGCRGGVKIVEKEDPTTGEKKKFFIPKHYVDFYIRVKGKGKDQYPLYKSTELVKALINDWRINIAGVSTDGFQSIELQQNLKIAFPGIEVEQISVDATDAHYLAFRNLLYMQALGGMYADKNLVVELFDLKHIITSRRGRSGNMYQMIVDHPTIASDGFVGRKDVADALCANQALIRSIDVSKSPEEVKEEAEGLKRIDIDALTREAEVSVEEAMKEVEKLDLDSLFNS